MEIESSNLFLEVDELFDGKSVDASKFNANRQVPTYCPEKNGHRICNNDYQRINAIGSHLHMELGGKHDRISGRGSDKRFIEYLIMWLSHILYKKLENNNITLISVYDNHLKDNFGNYSYWNLLGKKFYLTDGNIAIMNIFYLLFHQICETIKKYQTKGAQAHEYVNKAAQCYIIYTQLYNFIKKCDPYLELLDHLKTPYNNFINSAKSQNLHGDDVADKLIELPSIGKTKFESSFESA
ncbi:Plasmodium variant antigen protein Cir/Yir/Bir, putative, partial [Plasmodium chabaudi chabaudi]